MNPQHQPPPERGRPARSGNARRGCHEISNALRHAEPLRPSGPRSEAAAQRQSQISEGLPQQPELEIAGLTERKFAPQFSPKRPSILPRPTREDGGEGARTEFPQPFSKHRPRHAFTLLELILVMALLTIVLSVSSPSLANFFRGRTLDSEARRFLSLTRYAQSRAVSEGVPMQLWIDDQARTYGLQADPGFTPDDAKAVSFQIAPDLTLEIAAAPPVRNSAMRSTASSAPTPAARTGVTTLCFQPDGFLSPNNPTSIRFRGSDDATLTLSQSRNRLNYEIQSDTPR